MLPGEGLLESRDQEKYVSDRLVPFANDYVQVRCTFVLSHINLTLLAAASLALL